MYLYPNFRQYRRDCLRALGTDYTLEFKFLDEFADANPKNYQIWHHRRAVVEASGFPSAEKAFTEAVLLVDDKNYHAWSHRWATSLRDANYDLLIVIYYQNSIIFTTRQWALRTFDLFYDELDFTEMLLGRDLYNNSAWNQVNNCLIHWDLHCAWATKSIYSYYFDFSFIFFFLLYFILYSDGSWFIIKNQQLTLVT